MAIARKGFAKSQIQGTPEQYRKFQQQVADYTRANNQFARTHGGHFATPGEPINLGVVRRPATAVSVDGAASASVGILGAASVASPALVPFAAAAGIGYGIYKLGESFKLW